MADGLPRVLDVARTAGASDAPRHRPTCSGGLRGALVPDRTSDPDPSAAGRRAPAGGYWVVLSSSSEAPPGARVPAARPLELDQLTVLRRPNSATTSAPGRGHARVPPVLSADKVLVLNDSLVGPFRPLDPISRHFEATPRRRVGADRHRPVRQPPPVVLPRFPARGADRAAAGDGSGGTSASRRQDGAHRGERVWLRALREPGTAHLSLPSCITGEVVAAGENPRSPAGAAPRRRLPFVKREHCLRPGLAPDGERVASADRGRL